MAALDYPSAVFPVYLKINMIFATPITELILPSKCYISGELSHNFYLFFNTKNCKIFYLFSEKRRSSHNFNIMKSMRPYSGIFKDFSEFVQVKTINWLLTTSI